MDQNEISNQSQPQKPHWRQVAGHGKAIGWLTWSCVYLLIGIVKKIEFSQVTSSSYFGYLIYLALIAVFTGPIGAILGSAIGALVGVCQPKLDVAKAVTATAAVIVCTGLLSCAALFTRLFYE